MNHKPEPDTTLDHAPWSASPPRGAQLDGGALTSDDYYTPKWLFDAINLTFDIDVASPPQGPPHTPCKRFYTKADNGLIQPWYGRVWMNPPYSKPKPWVERWINHGNGIALLPMNGGQWLNTLWNSNAKGVWLGRLPFIRNGKEQKGTSFNVVLWAIGNDNIDAISTIGYAR